MIFFIAIIVLAVVSYLWGFRSGIRATEEYWEITETDYHKRWDDEN